MAKYGNEEYLKRRIMNDSWHLFLYGYANKHRSEVLESLEKDYPLIPDSDKPVALYFNSLGIPKIDDDFSEKDRFLMEFSNREFIYFTIATKILEKSMVFDINMLNERLARLISLVNNGKSVEQLLGEVKRTRDFYYENYLKYVKGLIGEIPIAELKLPYIDLTMFAMRYKECMNMSSHFTVIFDKQSPLSIHSVREINTLIGSRITGDISIRVAIEPDKWESYYDSYNGRIECPHDYSTLELDDSYQKYMKSLRSSHS